MNRPSFVSRISLLLVAFLIMGAGPSTVGLPVAFHGNVASQETLESEDKVVILVRHAEKCEEPEDNPGLTPLGRERATAFVRVMTDVDVDAIYSTPFERTLDTVRPLADERGLDIIQTPIRSGFLQAMVESIKVSEAGTIIVSGHSNTTPRVVNLLAGTSYPDLDESEYDRLYVVHLPAEGMPRVTILRYGPPSGSVEAC